MGRLVDDGYKERGLIGLIGERGRELTSSLRITTSRGSSPEVAAEIDNGELICISVC
jgi:flagellar biosynthesis/type III secretory pathway ATPase